MKALKILSLVCLASFSIAAIWWDTAVLGAVRNSALWRQKVADSAGQQDELAETVELIILSRSPLGRNAESESKEHSVTREQRAAAVEVAIKEKKVMAEPAGERVTTKPENSTGKAESDEVTAIEKTAPPPEQVATKNPTVPKTAVDVAGKEDERVPDPVTPVKDEPAKENPAIESITGVAKETGATLTVTVEVSSPKEIKPPASVNAEVSPDSVETALEKITKEQPKKEEQPSQAAESVKEVVEEISAQETDTGIPVATPITQEKVLQPALPVTVEIVERTSVFESQISSEVKFSTTLDENVLYKDFGPPTDRTLQKAEVRRKLVASELEKLGISSRPRVQIVALNRSEISETADKPVVVAIAVAAKRNGGHTPAVKTLAADIMEPTPSPAKFLYDGFEGRLLWAEESAVDHVSLEKATAYSTEQKSAMKAVFKKGEQGKFEIRREVSLKLPEDSRFTVDMFNPNRPMQVSLMMYADVPEIGWRRYATQQVEVKAGWNKALAFSLNKESFPKDLSELWPKACQNIIRLGWTFTLGENDSGALYLDNLRMNADPVSAELDPEAPQIRNMKASSKDVQLHGLFEISLQTSFRGEDCFDRNQADIIGSFYSPSGQKQIVHGFPYGIGKEKVVDWQVHFAPDEAGKWNYLLTIKGPNGVRHTESHQFTCVDDKSAKGMVRISIDDPQYFEFDNGQFFYPIGQNISWSGSYEHYFSELIKAGGNSARIWVCPWNLQFDGPRHPDGYDLEISKRLDKLFEIAETKGISILLVIEYHGMLQWDWGKNPFNQANGGPCKTPWEFFTNPEAIERFKRRLDYMVARWGHSSALMAWELWNEVDLVNNWDFLVTKDKFKQIIEWHRQVGSYLKKIDPYRHLVTTSTSNTNQFDDIYKLKEIDFIPRHFYRETVIEDLVKQFEIQKEFKKPYFVSEFSGGTDPRSDQKDVAGRRLHAGLWAAFMTPTAGNAMPWWWDIHVKKFGLYYHFKALSEFAKGEDRRGRDYQFLNEIVTVNPNVKVDVLGLYNRRGAYLWIHDRASLQDPTLPEAPILPSKMQLALEGFEQGVYEIEVWDTYEGKVVRRNRKTSRKNGLLLELDSSARDFAVKIRRADAAAKPVIRLFK